jgi:pilus assembly protein Flp/PilA
MGQPFSLTAMVGVGNSPRGYSMSKVVAFLSDESGASAAEYALILAIVGIGIVTAATALQGAIGGAMNRTASTIAAN